MLLNLYKIKNDIPTVKLPEKSYTQPISHQPQPEA